MERDEDPNTEEDRKFPIAIKAACPSIRRLFITFRYMDDFYLWDNDRISYHARGDARKLDWNDLAMAYAPSVTSSIPAPLIRIRAGHTQIIVDSFVDGEIENSLVSS
jgi:hypothetical protein